MVKVDFGFSQEEDAFRKSVREWVDAKYPKPKANALERREDHDGSNFPHELWKDMADAGFFGIGIDPEWGGQSGGAMIQVIMMEELARNLAGLTWLWGIQSFNAKSIQKFGSTDLKREILPSLVDGTIRTAIAATEPSGGTDLLGSMVTRAVPDGEGYRITGSKVWSTLSHVADYLLLLATTKENTEKPALGKTLFLLDTKQDGIEIRTIPKLGMRAVASCEVFLDGAYVPDTHVIGEVDRGFYHMLTTLNNERILVAAMCLGVLRGVIEDAVAHAKHRIAWGKPIGQLQTIQTYIADMQIGLQQAELLTYRAAWMYDQGLDCGIESSVAKAKASEYAVEAADHGIQILGGMGYSAEFDMQRYWRDVRIQRIGPITNEMVRNLVAESLGLPRSF